MYLTLSSWVCYCLDIYENLRNLLIIIIIIIIIKVFI